MFVNIIWLIPLGWAAGALANYLADALPFQRRLPLPACVFCKARQPLFNYFFWPRKCAACGQRRPLRVFIVELAAIAITIWLWYYPPTQSNFVMYLLLTEYFGVVVVIDLEHHLILHQVSIFGAALGLVIGWMLHGPRATILGGVAGFTIMLGLYYAGILLMKLLNRKSAPAQPGDEQETEALGFGDVALGGVIGLVLGWPGIIAGLTFAILIGGAVSLVYLLIALVRRRYHAFSAIPYGPFLIAGALWLLYFRDAILTHL